MHEDTAVWFDSFSSKPFSVIPLHIIVVAGTLLTLFFGAHSIEKTNKIMMPLFFIIFLILAVRVAMLPGAAEGYKFMFTPDWTKLADPMIWIWAMGQAFFSLSLGIAAMEIFGSYIRRERRLTSEAISVTALNTVVAISCWFNYFPACLLTGHA